MAKSRNSIIIEVDSSIGRNAAEQDDDFLFQCFEDNPMVSAVSDLNSPKSFLAGRTGDGKTAALRMILKNNEDYSSEVNLLDMALDYVSNSDILRFVSELGVDLSLFFQTLWKHVLVIEYIRLKFHIDSDVKSRSWFDSFGDFFKNDPTQERALEYLRKWGGRFWITMDESISQVTDHYTKGLEAELGSELAAANAKVGYTRNLSKEKKTNFVHRAKQVLDSKQLAELSKVLLALKRYGGGDAGKTYYVIIDRIDERWVDESIRFRLIGALIDALRSFGKIRDLKVIVAIRVDVLERVISETRDLGFQRDKFSDQSHRIRWTKEQLKSVVNKRIGLMCRRAYTKENVTFEHLFKNKVNGKRAFDYILERTFYRPRDLIIFVNECLVEAVHKGEITATDVKNAERTYSNQMVDSLVSEWASVFPSLKSVLDKLSGKKTLGVLEDVIDETFLVDLCVMLESRGTHDPDAIKASVKNYFDNNSPGNYKNALCTIASALYTAGVMGLKLQSNDRYRFSYKDEPQLGQGAISLETKYQIHSAFHVALNTEFTKRD